MSQIRPTLTQSDDPGLTYRQTFFRVMQSVMSRRSLIHGKLKDDGETCAVGAYFEDSDMPISGHAIDEIAAYNDSFPKLTPHQRWLKVSQWLKVRAKQLHTK